MSTSKIFEVSKKHAQRKSRAACCRGFSLGVNKTNYATDKPRERLRKRLKKKKPWKTETSSGLKNVNLWLQANKLSLNIKKRILLFLKRERKNKRRQRLKLVITKGYVVRATTIKGQNAFAPSLCFT